MRADSEKFSVPNMCSDPGKLYTASPYVVASAIAGKIVEPDEFLHRPE